MVCLIVIPVGSRLVVGARSVAVSVTDSSVLPRFSKGQGAI